MWIVEHSAELGASLLMIIADARDGWNMNMNGFLSGSGSRRETSRGPGSVLTVAGAGDQAISRHGRPGPGQLRHRGQQRNAFSHRVRLIHSASSNGSLPCGPIYFKH